jgi:tRNA(Ile)-lysidine synthase
VFAQLQPKDVRFTLPAVFRVDSTTGKESLVGFPTLGVSMNTLGAPTDVCEWSVRYKKIDTGRRSAEDIVVPGISHALDNSDKTKSVGFGAVDKRNKRMAMNGKSDAPKKSRRGPDKRKRG